MPSFKIKRLIIFAHDFFWVPASVLLAYWFRFNLAGIPGTAFPGILQLLWVTMPAYTATFWYFGCYRGIWRFASLPDLVRILKAVISGAIVSAVCVFLYSRFEGIPRSVIVLYPILMLLGVGTSRIMYRILRTHRVNIDIENKQRALIVGAGRAGNLLIRDLLEHGPFIPVGLVDDDVAKHGTDLHGIRVIGRIADIRMLVGSLHVEAVIIAMPSAPRFAMDAIVKICTELKVPCRTLPSLIELADGRVEVSRLRPVTVHDLLGREPVRLDERAIDGYLQGKGVAITGGGGSIGSELCRQVLAHNPRYLLIIESSEFNLYSIERELSAKFPEAHIIPALADVRVREAIESLFGKYLPNVVFHAAAYKHVPMVEENIVEAVRNNVFGTRIVADAAVKFGVSTFLLVSTDKTVNPTNVMGATKRIAEIYCQTLNTLVATHFVTTRFGNVLGSAGSVVPLFEQQIKAGGPVTVTHPDITRYFMTIPEAAALILQGGSMGKGGEIFVLDMGNPVKIRDLAENMIRLSGLRPGDDIQIEYVGLRPGEKMHEELFYCKEEMVGTSHPKLLLANSYSVNLPWLQDQLLPLSKAIEHYDEDEVLISVKNIVPEFNHYVPTTSKQEKDMMPMSRLRVIK